MRSSYSFIVYNADPVPTPGTRYIDKDKKVFIIRGPVVEYYRRSAGPILSGLDDWDQGYSFNLYPENEHHLAAPKGKLTRIIPKEEIQKAKDYLLEQLRDADFIVSVGMDDSGVLVYVGKDSLVKVEDHVGYVPVRVVRVN